MFVDPLSHCTFSFVFAFVLFVLFTSPTPWRWTCTDASNASRTLNCERLLGSGWENRLQPRVVFLVVVVVFLRVELTIMPVRAGGVSNAVALLPLLSAYLDDCCEAQNPLGDQPLTFGANDRHASSPRRRQRRRRRGPIGFGLESPIDVHFVSEV